MKVTYKPNEMVKRCLMFRFLFSRGKFNVDNKTTEIIDEGLDKPAELDAKLWPSDFFKLM